MYRTADHKPKLALFSLFVVFATTFLLYAGGFTTSIGAGMAFPDWPLSNGSLNPEGWLEDQAMLAEHSHRLLGASIGLLTLSLAVWTWKKDSRKWMRMLALASLVTVVMQGLLGGFRVLFNNLQFAMIHACLAQVYLCILVSIAAAQSAWWRRPILVGIGESAWWRRTSMRANDGMTPNRVKSLGLILCSLIFTQLIVGAIMRHSGAGLAIPTFPLTPEGDLIPNNWTFPIAIHFAHRAIAVIISLVYLCWAIRIIWNESIDPRIKCLGFLGIILIFTQITLGALIILTYRSPIPTTFHVFLGAYLFALTWLITFFQFKDEVVTIEPYGQVGIKLRHSNVKDLFDQLTNKLPKHAKITLDDSDPPNIDIREGNWRGLRFYLDETSGKLKFTRIKFRIPSFLSKVWIFSISVFLFSIILSIIISSILGEFSLVLAFGGIPGVALYLVIEKIIIAKVRSSWSPELYKLIQ